MLYPQAHMTIEAAMQSKCNGELQLMQYDSSEHRRRRQQRMNFLRHCSQCKLILLLQCNTWQTQFNRVRNCKQKSKGSPYSTAEHRLPQLIPVLGSQPAGDVSHKPGGRLPLLSARPTVILATLKRAAISFAAW